MSVRETKDIGYEGSPPPLSKEDGGSCVFVRVYGPSSTKSMREAY